MPDLSVIIPIYNTPTNALQRCFDSLLALTGISWEAILIDDGSKEETGLFCREYVEKHPHFSYFWQQNGGVSAARNLGLSKACGRYVTFVDADDMLLPDAFTHQLLQSDTHLTIFDMTLCQNGNSNIWSALKVQPGDLSRESVLQCLITCKDLNSPCAKLFLKERIDALQLRFRTDFVTGEDWFFVTQYVSQSESFRYVNVPCYCYFRDGSSGNSRLARFPDTMLRNHIAMFEQKQQLITKESWSNIAAQTLSAAAAGALTEDLFNCAATLLLLRLYSRERKKMIRSAIEKAKPALSALPLKSRLKAYTILYFPPALWLLAALRAVYLRLK